MSVSGHHHVRLDVSEQLTQKSFAADNPAQEWKYLVAVRPPVRTHPHTAMQEPVFLQSVLLQNMT